MDLPKILKERKDLFEKYNSIAGLHLGEHYQIIKDCSGMSNPVFIVANQDKSKKIILRFFESKTADFQLENQVFDTASSKGYCPKSIESDNKTFRVEEFFDGRPFKNCELKVEETQKKCAKLIYNFNNDTDLQKLCKDMEPKAIEYINSK